MNTPGIFLKLGATALITVCLSMTACSTTTTKADRDTSGKYDGNWTGKVHTAQSPQIVHNWQMQCSDLSQVIKMQIADGVVTTKLWNQTYTSFINRKGKFKIIIDAGKTSASDSSDSSLSNPNVRVSVGGNLGRDPAVGTLTVGLAEVGFAGCDSKIDYNKS